VQLAGVPVRDEDVLDLARLLHDAGCDDTAEVLVVALEAEQAIVALTIQDREAILRSLDDRPLAGSRSCVARCLPSTGGGSARGWFSSGGVPATTGA
jgi:hypothetical protein